MPYLDDMSTLQRFPIVDFLYNLFFFVSDLAYRRKETQRIHIEKNTYQTPNYLIFVSQELVQIVNA